MLCGRHSCGRCKAGVESDVHKSPVQRAITPQFPWRMGAVHECDDVYALGIVNIKEFGFVIIRGNFIRDIAVHQCGAVGMKSDVMMPKLKDHCLGGRECERDQAAFSVRIFGLTHH